MQNVFLSVYHIKETIGKGTFSIVKLGINKATNEKVAIKILKKKKILHKADKSRLEREISILKKLNHINVINSLKINEDSDNYYIVMEYCENGELFNYIVERQKLDEDEASYFFYQLINGLDYIHHKNIVHRDLKPENLLLGKGNILKIVDFGLSNFYEEERLLSTPCGSPCYASPEMVCGNKYNGLMIDIWSCGIIIFAMTCGFLPFEDANNELLFKKIMKCKIDYPEFLSDTVLDILKKILVVDPNKRITIEQIRNHPFYIKGKNIFEYKHKNLVCQVEKIIDDDIVENNNNEENSNDGIKDNKNELNMKKSKSSNYIENENIIKNNNIKYKIKKFFIDNNITPNGNKSTMNGENSTTKDKNNKSFGLIAKKFHININSIDKDNVNRDINKIMSINYELKDINNNRNTNDNTNQIEESKKILKKIKKDALSLREKNHKDKYKTDKLVDLYTQNFPLSNDIHRKLADFETPNFIEEYQNNDKNKNKNIIHNGKTKINLNLLQQLLKKEKLGKYKKDKNFLIHSPVAKKNSDSLSYVLPLTKKKKSEDKTNNNDYKTEYKNKIKSLNIENEENNSERIGESSNPTNRSDKSNNNKSILSYNNKHHDNLELIKYGISNKDINDILFQYNKNVNKLYEPNTTKNKQTTNIENITNKESEINTNDYNYGNYNNNNVHIKNLRILNNNNYNNIKNITNINNVKSINNIIICNSPLKSLIKDVHYLTKISSNNNNDLPNINLNSNNIHKELKTMSGNNIKNINNLNISNSNKSNITSPSNNNNILIPKILLTKDINNLEIYNNYNSTNLSKMYIGSLNKKLNNINKKNSVKNLIHNYKNNASSIEYLNKKAMPKKQFSERNFNSYGYDFINEIENNSINKKDNIAFTTKNKMNLNKIKNKVDPFTYGRNKENLITLKKIKYNDGINNFNTEKNNTKKISANNLIK